VPIKLMCPPCEQDKYEVLISLEEGLPIAEIRCPDCGRSIDV